MKEGGHENGSTMQRSADLLWKSILSQFRHWVACVYPVQCGRSMSEGMKEVPDKSSMEVELQVGSFLPKIVSGHEEDCVMMIEFCAHSFQCELLSFDP